MPHNVGFVVKTLMAYIAFLFLFLHMDSLEMIIAQTLRYIHFRAHAALVFGFRHSVFFDQMFDAEVLLLEPLRAVRAWESHFSLEFRVVHSDVVRLLVRFVFEDHIAFFTSKRPVRSRFVLIEEDRIRVARPTDMTDVLLIMFIYMYI